VKDQLKKEQSIMERNESRGAKWLQSSGEVLGLKGTLLRLGGKHSHYLAT
jgi:hypothetical protein